MFSKSRKSSSSSSTPPMATASNMAVHGGLDANVPHAHLSDRKPPVDNTRSFAEKQKQALEAQSLEMGDLLSRRYRGISVFMAIMLLLAVAIVWTAVLVAEQTQQYHEEYMSLQQMEKEYHRLLIEHQRLTIEQQTFSATPQIASRAVTELGMFSPTTKDKLILQPSKLSLDASAPTMTEQEQDVAEQAQRVGASDE